MKPTSSNAPESKYPQYYILDINDLVEEFLAKWHDIIASEVFNPAPVLETEMVYPEVHSVDAYSGEVVKTVHVAQHHQILNKPWHPDISFIMHQVIDTIKQRVDGEDLDLVLQLLEYDIAAMVHYQLLPNVSVPHMTKVYSDTRMRVAKLAGEFGKKIFYRMLAFGLYKEGYFPYHFAGWQDTCALVELDTTHR